MAEPTSCCAVPGGYCARVDARVVPHLPGPGDYAPRSGLAVLVGAVLAYFTTGRANNGGTEAVNGSSSFHRRIARGFRNPSNYRLRMILAAGKLTHPNLR